jgi:hypothetical protein
VLVPPVGNGVEKLDGSSEVKIVAVEGERVYLAARVDRSAGVNPATVSHGGHWAGFCMTYRAHGFHFQE